MNLLIHILTAGSVRRVLSPLFPRSEVQRIKRAAWQRYQETEWPSPHEWTFGAQLMVRFAAFSISFFEALKNAGVEEDQALAIISQGSWLVYRKIARVPTLLARLISRTPTGRLRQETRLFRRFPFGPPSYVMKDQPSPKGAVAFDVLQCPVAQYYRERGHAKLCKAAFCDLDYPLAKLWGVHLERTTTLAEGADRCDFRWSLTPPVHGFLVRWLRVVRTGPNLSTKAQQSTRSRKVGP